MSRQLGVHALPLPAAGGVVVPRSPSHAEAAAALRPRRKPRGKRVAARKRATRGRHAATTMPHAVSVTDSVFSTTLLAPRSRDGRAPRLHLTQFSFVPLSQARRQQDADAQPSPSGADTSRGHIVVSGFNESVVLDPTLAVNGTPAPVHGPNGTAAKRQRRMKPIGAGLMPPSSPPRAPESSVSPSNFSHTHSHSHSKPPWLRSTQSSRDGLTTELQRELTRRWIQEARTAFSSTHRLSSQHDASRPLPRTTLPFSGAGARSGRPQSAGPTVRRHVPATLPASTPPITPRRRDDLPPATLPATTHPQQQYPASVVNSPPRPASVVNSPPRSSAPAALRPSQQHPQRSSTPGRKARGQVRERSRGMQPTPTPRTTARRQQSTRGTSVQRPKSAAASRRRPRARVPTTPIRRPAPAPQAAPTEFALLQELHAQAQALQQQRDRLLQSPHGGGPSSGGGFQYQSRRNAPLAGAQSCVPRRRPSALVNAVAVIKRRLTEAPAVAVHYRSALEVVQHEALSTASLPQQQRQAVLRRSASAGALRRGGSTAPRRARPDVGPAQRGTRQGSSFGFGVGFGPHHRGAPDADSRPEAASPDGTTLGASETDDEGVPDPSVPPPPDGSTLSAPLSLQRSVPELPLHSDGHAYESSKREASQRQSPATAQRRASPAGTDTPPAFLAVLGNKMRGDSRKGSARGSSVRETDRSQRDNGDMRYQLARAASAGALLRLARPQPPLLLHPVATEDHRDDDRGPLSVGGLAVAATTPTSLTTLADQDSWTVPASSWRASRMTEASHRPLPRSRPSSAHWRKHSALTARSAETHNTTDLTSW